MPHSSEDKKPAEPPTDIFGTAFAVWCFVVFVGSLATDKGSAAYGALTPGAMFGIAALISGGVALVLAVLRQKDRRAWISLGLCLLALIFALQKTPHGGGP